MKLLFLNAAEINEAAMTHNIEIASLKMAAANIALSVLNAMPKEAGIRKPIIIMKQANLSLEADGVKLQRFDMKKLVDADKMVDFVVNSGYEREQLIKNIGDNFDMGNIHKPYNQWQGGDFNRFINAIILAVFALKSGQDPKDITIEAVKYFCITTAIKQSKQAG